jgi:hypothetical protein
MRLTYGGMVQRGVSVMNAATSERVLEVTASVLSKKGNFTLVIQVMPRWCSGHALVILSQTGSQRNCECRKFNNNTIK